METVFGQALALRLEKQDEHRPVESDTTGLKMSRGSCHPMEQLNSLLWFLLILSFKGDSPRLVTGATKASLHGTFLMNLQDDHNNPTMSCLFPYMFAPPFLPLLSFWLGKANSVLQRLDCLSQQGEKRAEASTKDKS